MTVSIVNILFLFVAVIVNVADNDLMNFGAVIAQEVFKRPWQFKVSSRGEGFGGDQTAVADTESALIWSDLVDGSKEP